MTVDRSKGKVYDYNTVRVREKLVGAFRSRRNEATVADLVALTGLPVLQVRNELPAVADEYSARMRVTESGEILYSFPSGMKSRYRGFGHSLRRTARTALRFLGAAGTVAFKAWIALMLVGYFVLFIALAGFALLASIAMSQAGGDSRSSGRRGGGLGGLWLTSRLFDAVIRIWFYSEMFGSGRGRSLAGSSGFGDRSRRSTPKRPLHKAVFSHVFGDGDPDATWADVEKRAVVAFLQSNKGIITLPEFMAITGLAPAGADAAINRYLLEFGGTPEVSDEGTLYFSFPDLLRRKDLTDRTHGFSIPLRRIATPTSNTRKTDTVFRLVNLANILFGGYFLYGATSVADAWFRITSRGTAVLRGGIDFLYSVTAYLFQEIIGIMNPAVAIFWGLGVAPLAFSLLFYLIPFVRSRRLESRNERSRTENLRRIVTRAVWDGPKHLLSSAIPEGGAESTPKHADTVKDRLIGDLAAWSGADPGSDGAWSFPAIERMKRDVERIRASVDESAAALGATVFDSHT